MATLNLFLLSRLTGEGKKNNLEKSFSSYEIPKGNLYNKQLPGYLGIVKMFNPLEILIAESAIAK